MTSGTAAGLATDVPSDLAAQLCADEVLQGASRGGEESLPVTDLEECLQKAAPAGACGRALGAGAACGGWLGCRRGARGHADTEAGPQSVHADACLFTMGV